MTVPMSSEIRRALSEAGDQPVRVVDSESNSAYVLVPEVAYEAIEELRELRDTYAAQETVARAAGWDQHIMDEYDDYDTHRKARLADEAR